MQGSELKGEKKKQGADLENKPKRKKIGERERRLRTYIEVEVDNNDISMTVKI